VLAQLAQDIPALLRPTRRQLVLAGRDDARHGRDDLRQVFVQRWRWRRRGAAATYDGEHALNRVKDGFGLCLQIWLEKATSIEPEKKGIRKTGLLVP
jgi:hypothetical protein